MTHSHDHRIDQAITVLRQILRATELHERELAQSAGLTISKLRVLQALASREGRSATPTHLAQKFRSQSGDGDDAGRPVGKSRLGHASPIRS